MGISGPAICILILVNIVFAEADEQYTIDRVELMPEFPQPFEIRDWKQVAIDYNEFVFDFGRSGDYLPLNYSLTHNYPNPFNPATAIQYELPVRTHVRITVLDLLGRRIEMLVDESKEPGKHLVRWNASWISSGVYFYKIQTADFMDIRKCIVIK